MTKLSRRSFITGISAVGAVPLLPKHSRANGTQAILRATTSTAQLTPEGYPGTDVWAYAKKGAGTVLSDKVGLSGAGWSHSVGL